MRIQLVTVLVLLTLALSGCAGGNPFAPKEPLVLTGSVTDMYTGDPVADAAVRIGETSLTTAEDGTYSTPAWTADDILEVEAIGYAATTIPLAQHADEEPQETVVYVQQDAELRPTTLRGTVTDSQTEQPIADALVTVDVLSGTATIDTLETTTSEDGSYHFEGLSEAFVLSVSAPDHAPLTAELERTTSYDVALRPDVLTGSVTDQYSGEPIADVAVSAGDMSVSTDDSGAYRLKGLPTATGTVTFAAEGYASVSLEYDVADSAIDATLRPDVLSAILVDLQSGEPISHATVIATTTPTSTALTSVRIDKEPSGEFTLDDVPETGYLQILAPGYRKAMLEIQPGSIPSRIELEPFAARALYVKTSTVAWWPEQMELLLDTIEQDEELNALVIDLKSDNLADLGLIYYDSQVPIVQELGTSEPIIDMQALLAETKRRNIYTIARIHVFSHDNLLAETMPEWAAQNALGCVPNENRKCNGDVFYADWDIAWLDPWNRNVWDYNIQLGVEAAQMGFDEVQFDYIRFPNDASEIEHMVLSEPFDWKENPTPMYENIVEVMTLAHEAFNNHGAFFSVDIFGYAAWAPQPYIGQRADWMSEHADYICPMIYPSHFWVNELGFENAAAHPYEIVEASLNQGQAMIQDNRARMRPWLQDFTLLWVPDHLIVRYGVNEVRAQINATEASPYGVGWALWDPDNEYTLDVFR